MVLVAMLLSSLANVALAAGDTIYIYPFSYPNGHYVVDGTAGDVVRIDWLAATKTKGQLEMFIKSEETTYTLHDETTNHDVWILTPTQADAFWTEPYLVPPSWWGLECNKDMWEATFSPGFPELEPGHTYTLTSQFINRHPANDGLQMCGGVGPPSIFPAYQATAYVTIEVN